MWFRLKYNTAATNKKAGTGEEEFHWLIQPTQIRLVEAETVELS